MLCIVPQILMNVPVVLNKDSLGLKDGDHAMVHQKMHENLAFELL
uniref:Uncharacterized protein n=1 Tax=Arundo donax TaxID=35708 RepID=A0A0A9DS48_ARUDO